MLKSSRTLLLVQWLLRSYDSNHKHINPQVILWSLVYNMKSDAFSASELNAIIAICQITEFNIDRPDEADVIFGWRVIKMSLVRCVALIFFHWIISLPPLSLSPALICFSYEASISTSDLLATRIKSSIWHGTNTQYAFHGHLFVRVWCDFYLF